MEIITLCLFCAALLLSIVFGFNLLYALAAGIVIFCVYARIKGFGIVAIVKMILSGIAGAKNILTVFVLIGIITALWRDCGTIPGIISYAVMLIKPETVLAMTFVLCSAIAVLMGTAFGAAATMGVICMTMALAMGINPLLAGGAVLSGVYFGDRCSPVSTSALLVSELTHTTVFDNIKNMVKTAAVPFVLTGALYALIGFFADKKDVTIGIGELFKKEFSLSPVVLIPALVIIVLSALRVNVKITMLASIASALPISLFIQHSEPLTLLRFMIFGYTTENAELSEMMSGGGILSMVRVALIVCITSAYSGIFRKTDLLSGIKKHMNTLCEKTTPFVATLFTSVISSMVACNQTLSIMLTHQLCSDIYREEEKFDFAINLEDTAVIIAPLVPWSVAGTVALSSANAPTAAIMFSFFLYILPLWRLITSFAKKTKKTAKKHTSEKEYAHENV